MKTVQHPNYQHRFIDADGFPIITSVPSLLAPMQEGRTIVFGGWRPGGRFNPLTTLTFSDEGVTIEGLKTVRRFNKDELGDTVAPLFGIWCKITQHDEDLDRADREKGVKEFNDEQGVLRTCLHLGDTHEFASDEYSIRKFLERKAPMTYGAVDAETGTIPAPIARLDFHPGPTITFTGIEHERGLNFGPATATDLDRVARDWLDFVEQVREGIGMERLFASVKRAA